MGGLSHIFQSPGNKRKLSFQEVRWQEQEAAIGAVIAAIDARLAPLQRHVVGSTELIPPSEPPLSVEEFARLSEERRGHQAQLNEIASLRIQAFAKRKRRRKGPRVRKPKAEQAI